VAFYDSIATYDSALLYDDQSSPQTNRRKMAKVKLGLRNLTRDQKIDQANTIKTAMTGNANFPTPNPTLASYGTAITAVQTKLNAYNLLKAQTDTALSDCDAAIGTMDGLTTQLGDYVQNVSGGDRTKIESAGMSVRDDAAPIGTPAQVLNLVLTEGDFGDVGCGLGQSARREQLRNSDEPRSDHVDVVGFQTIGE
jgi:hypothetical protein